MKNQKFKVALLLIFIVQAFFVNAQSPLISPQRGNSTVCPNVQSPYSVIEGPNYSGCSSFSWTVSNGSFSSSSNDVTSITTTSPNVTVYWNNTTSDGTLSVTVTGCNEGTFTTSESYAIRSLTGRDPDNARALQTLPFCSTSGIALTVDEMTLQNTGGTTGIQLEYADGYEWDLPVGWTSGGSANGEVVSTSAPIINIDPVNGCSQGTATVRAYVTCGTDRKYSKKANIPLNRPQPNISISLPSGYSGPSCGDVQSRTFTTTAISCAASYSWIFPSGWSHSSFTTSGNSITVTPSGGADDGGEIQVNVTLDCESVFNKTRVLNFREPTISSPTAICSGGTNVSLSNVSTNTYVNWSVSSSTLSIVSGQGTANVVIKAATTSTKAPGTISTSVSCPNTPVNSKNVWAGLPRTPDVIGASLVDPGQYKVYQAVPFGQDPAFSTQGVGTPDFNWYFSFPQNGFSCYSSCNTYLPTIYTGTASTMMNMKMKNGCGWSGVRQFAISVEQDDCPPRGCIEPFSVYPNPASSTLVIEPNKIKGNSSEAQLSGITEKPIVELYDFDQNRVYQSTLNGESMAIDLRTFKKGIYLLKIHNSGGELVNQTIVVE